MQKLPHFWWIPFGSVPEVAPDDLRRQLESDDPPQILDVRTRREYNNGHIPGAVHVPITRLRSRVERLPFDPRKPVVTICLTAHRSIPAVRALKTCGYRNVRQLAGGMSAWRKINAKEESL